MIVAPRVRALALAGLALAGVARRAAHAEPVVDVAAPLRAACRAQGAAPVRVEIPTPALEYREGALVADLGRAISLDGGSVELFPAGDEGAELEPMPMATPQAAALVRAQSRGRLAARLTVELAPGALVAEPCLSLAGGRILRVRYRAVSLELFDLASDEGKTRRRAAVILRAPGVVDPARAMPRVSVGPTEVARRDEHGRAALDHALGELQIPAQRCYTAALERRPELSGRIVFALSVEHGRITVAGTPIDALGDAELSACLKTAIEAVRAPSGLRMAGASLPIAVERR